VENPFSELLDKGAGIMKNQNKIYSILIVALITLALMFITSGCERTITNSIAEETESSDPNRYLNAVREFADNVLKYGRDTYGSKHTPLFVDGFWCKLF
jgi:hypothetical protein